MESAILQPMLQSISLERELDAESTCGPSIAMGVARRWESQQIATLPGVRIAVDADLYNIRELKEAIASSGIDARDWSVAQCLGQLYLLNGLDFLQRLNGVFSLGLWDERTQQLVLACDRLGCKELYWAREADRLLFGTRIGAIRKASRTACEINPAAITQYLIYSVVPHPLTIYKGVERLAPATYLVFENGSVRQARYWDLEYTEDNSASISYWAEKVREAMRASVHLNLEGCEQDRVGAYLSGGTDSSSVVAFMNELHSPVNSFSIFFSEGDYSEAQFVRTTANCFRTRQHDRKLGPKDALEVLPRLARCFDEPFANSSAFGAYFCAAMAHEAGMQTLLAGDGGDELFAGNSRYADDKRFSLYQSLPAWFRRSVLEPVIGLLPESDGVFSLPGRYVRRARIPNPRRIFSYNLFLSTHPAEVFQPDFLAQSPPDTWMSIAEGHFHSARASSELNRILYLDVKMILADNDLRKVSATAELAGVRVRYPLLDYRLAEVSAQIPSSLKLKGFEKRYIFKKAMQGILPREVLYKKKHGFGVPLSHWLIQDPQLNEFTMDVLCDSRTRQRGYFQPAFLDQLLHQHRQGHRQYYGEVVWYLLALELWHRYHYDAPSNEEYVK
jgi:asparagine synthase (glutamine-hydrolysing)